MFDYNHINQILNATLSPDNSTRRRAEEEIITLSKNPGLAEIFLQIIANASTSHEIKMAASLAFKNFVRLNWSNDGEAPLDESERAKIRSNVLYLLFEVPEIFRRQLSQAACYIGKYDFPDKWPELIDVICKCLTVSEDFERLVAALSTLEELVERYRHELRSNQLFLEILKVMASVGEPITKLFLKLLQLIPTPNAPDSMNFIQRKTWLELLNLIVNCYLSLIIQDLPEYFEDNVIPWMDGFLKLLKLSVPIYEQQCYNTEPSVLEKMKGTICQIITVYSQRFEDCFIKDDIPEKFVSTVWSLLVEIDSRVRFDSLVNYALGFLSAICQRSHYEKFFCGEGVLQTICDHVIVKNFFLREEDFDMYESEPLEYLKRDIEGSDLETRRRGACDFVKALCKFFEPSIFQILGSTVTNYLSAYQQEPKNNFIKKNVVYYLVSAMASKTTTVKYGSTSTSQLINVSDFYEQHVRTDLFVDDVNYLPILKGDALKYLILFRNQLKLDFLIEAICGVNGQAEKSIMRLLTSKHIILHHYVAYTIERLFLIKTGDGQLLFNSSNVPVGNYIQSLFNCLSDSSAYNTHYIVKALMRCFLIIDSNIAQNAHVYIENLGQIIMRAIRNPINSQLIHYVFESICVLIKKAYFNKVSNNIDGFVLTIIEFIIQEDVVDFVPYALQIIALLLDQSKYDTSQNFEEKQKKYFIFIPLFFNNMFWSRSSNIPALVLGLESFIDCFPQVILNSEYINQVLGIFQRLIASKLHDIHGFRLGAAMIPHLDTNNLNLKSRSLLLPMLNRLHTLKTSKFAKQFVLFFFRYVIVKGPSSLLQGIESIQTGMFKMLIDKIIITEMKGMPHMTTYDEKRIVSIGASILVSELVDELGEFYGPLVEKTIGILEVFERKKPEEEEQNIEINEFDTEYSDPYCKLSYAQHVDTLGKEIVNVQKFLAEATLAKAYNKKQDSINYLSVKTKNILHTYAST